MIATHERCYGREQDILNVFHYLPLLKQRPGSFDHAKPFKMWTHPIILDRYLDLLRDRLPHRAATMDFLRVIELCASHPLDKVATAVDQAMTIGSPGSDTVAYLLRTELMSGQPLPVTVLASAPSCPAVQSRDLSQYDRCIRR